MSQSELEIRPVRAGDDLKYELDLRRQAFGPLTIDRADAIKQLSQRASEGRLLGAFADGRLVGSALVLDLRQFWHGRPVPMAGVGGVKVAPELRGRGVGTALMRALMTSLREDYPLSVLFPATAQIYRSVGYELAGGHYQAEFDARSISQLIPPDPVLEPGPDEVSPPPRRVRAENADQVVQTIAAVHAAARDSGPAVFPADSVREWLSDDDIFCYLASDGCLTYGWDNGNKQIVVYGLEANSARTIRTFWVIIASHASIAKTVRVALGPDDPVRFLTREVDIRVSDRWTWMLRVLDPVSAIAGRGFPAAAEGQQLFVLEDPIVPANAGLWQLTVGAGKGSLEPVRTMAATELAAEPPVRLGPRGFAAMYGGTPLTTLRAAGLASGGSPAADAALDSVFAAKPYLLDRF